MCTYRGDGGDDFAQLQLVEDCGLAGGVQPDHKDPHLLLAEQALEQAGEDVSHCVVCLGGTSRERAENIREKGVASSRCLFMLVGVGAGLLCKGSLYFKLHLSEKNARY